MFELQETMAVPEPVMLVGLIAPQVRPEGTISVRLTGPAKRFTLAIVIVEEADEPALIGTGVDATIPKSLNWNRAVALWTRELLVPVTVRV
jgi:hypothetical protein